MHHSSLSNRKDKSQIFGLVLKMTYIYYFAYILFHTNLRIMKLVFIRNDTQ